MSYNDGLVERAVLLFSFDCLDRWDEELESVSDGEVGALFKYPTASWQTSKV